MGVEDMRCRLFDLVRRSTGCFFRLLSCRLSFGVVCLCDQMRLSVTGINGFAKKYESRVILIEGPSQPASLFFLICHPERA